MGNEGILEVRGNEGIVGVRGKCGNSQSEGEMREQLE